MRLLLVGWCVGRVMGAAAQPVRPARAAAQPVRPARAAAQPVRPGARPVDVSNRTGRGPLVTCGLVELGAIEEYRLVSLRVVRVVVGACGRERQQ